MQPCGLVRSFLLVAYIVAALLVMQSSFAKVRDAIVRHDRELDSLQTLLDEPSGARQGMPDLPVWSRPSEPNEPTIPARAPDALVS